jgi:hypothetical protein
MADDDMDPAAQSSRYYRDYALVTRQQLEQCLTALDELMMFQAGAYLAMAIDALDRRLAETDRSEPEDPGS